MPDPKDRQAFLNLCEMAIDNMDEMEALGELLEKKGLNHQARNSRPCEKPQTEEPTCRPAPPIAATLHR